MLLTATGGLMLGVSSAAAQFRLQPPARRALRQLERQQRPPKETSPGKKLEPKDTAPVKRPNPNQARGAGLPGQFTPEERQMVIRGVGPKPEVFIRTVRQLNLSDEQRMKLRDLAFHTGNRLVILNQLARAQNLALDEALYGQNFDPMLIEQRANEFADTLAQRVRAQSQIMAQIRQILTPEQDLRFRELLQQERNRQAALALQAGAARVLAASLAAVLLSLETAQREIQSAVKALCLLPTSSACN